MVAEDKEADECGTILLVVYRCRFISVTAAIHISRVAVEFIVVKPKVAPLPNDTQLFNVAIVAVTVTVAVAVAVLVRRLCGFHWIYLNE